jgi:hypothetical protein
MMEMWLEICEIAQYITFSMEEDLLIWKYESKGVYSSKSLYAIINFRGVQPVFLPAVWDLKIPPRVQIFLWLLSQNKIMTRDNLRHRGIQETLKCELCSELESVKHLFFDCLVSRLLWSVVQEIFDVEIVDYLSLASKWLCNKKFEQLNVVSSAVIWCIWNNRNHLVFNRKTWLSMKQVWGLLLSYLRIWQVPFKQLEWDLVEKFKCALVRRLRMMPSLMPD